MRRGNASSIHVSRRKSLVFRMLLHKEFAPNFRPSRVDRRSCPVLMCNEHTLHGPHASWSVVPERTGEYTASMFRHAPFAFALCVLALTLTRPSESLRKAIGQTAPDRVPAQGSDHSDSVILIPLEGGSVDCAALFDAVSEDLHWIAGSITAFRRGSSRLTGESYRLQPSQVDYLVNHFPEAFAFHDSEAGRHESLAVSLDSLAELLAEKKSRVRQALAGLQRQPLASLDKVDRTWTQETAEPPRIVVVLAGLHSLESTAESMAVKLHRRTNLPACVFSYPNDGPIVDSARMLQVQLADLHRLHPNSKVTLVAYSMGGLVARAAIEMGDPASAQVQASRSLAQRTGIDRLIQVCPPNHGSSLAEYGPLLEGAEQVLRLVNRHANSKNRELFHSIVDGFNEASSELEPDSKFLLKLNQCQRNPEIRYTILAGSEGPLGSGMAMLAGTVWQQLAAAIDEPKEVNRRIQDVLQCPELQRNRGDGVVSLDSARLDGVDDVQVIAMHHLVWNEPDSQVGKQLVDAIVQRLGISL